LWPATYYVSWGGFRFVRQTGKDEGRVFLFDGSGTNPRWRWAAEYGALRDSWYMREWNCKFCSTFFFLIECGVFLVGVLKMFY